VVSVVRPEVERAVRGIEEMFGARIAACERLRDFGLGFAEPWGGRPLGGVPDTIVAALFVRSSNTG
jgi:hypothetical protein